MTIAKALKQKNRLIKEIGELFSLVSEYNSIPEENDRPYNINELINTIKEKQEDLVDLKARIHTANSPVYKDIFKLSELKTRMKEFSSLETKEGIGDNSLFRRRSAEIKYKAEIGPARLQEMKKELQEEIDTLQDELDEWNSKTTI